MNIIDAMYQRNSVRRYTDEPLKDTDIKLINDEIDKLNAESGLKFILVTNEPEAFTGKMAAYGHFSGCTDYIICIGPKHRDEDIGYFGEKLVLFCQSIGINSCWVALTYSKSKVNFTLEKGEKFYIVISLGYGIHQGRPHKNKPIENLFKCKGEAPEWFMKGVKGTLFAPTAMNQQKFMLELINDHSVKAKALFGPYSKMDLGIVKYHFELCVGDYKFDWV